MAVSYEGGTPVWRFLMSEGPLYLLLAREHAGVLLLLLLGAAEREVGLERESSLLSTYWSESTLSS